MNKKARQNHPITHNLVFNGSNKVLKGFFCTHDSLKSIGLINN